ncbi:unnamed protein product [Angiostrongylus costaricensis]|uniref:C2H2-type domain-containing protein n=1 Tax=Angiostrongylus costaricensis TaxID=334426 RepID=A0A0R3PLC0_ANGCS|nr:unnamed protein product [Angiostrongylus costaricensis]
MTLTIRERIEIVLLAGDRRNHGEIAEEFSKRHPDRPISRVTIASVLAKFKQTGSVYHKSHLIRRSKDHHKCSDLLENFRGSLRDSERKAGSDLTDSRSPVHRMMQAPKGYRYILLEVDESRVDKLHDVLISNGFHDFVPLNNLPDDSDFMSNPVEELLTDVNGSDLLQTPTSSGMSFVAISISFSKGSRKVFGKNYSSGPFHSIPESSLDGPKSELDFRAVNGEQGEKSYVNCRLCKSMILTSRFSNLANHARRHAVVKKYRCVHCCVQNNEYSRVGEVVNAKSREVHFHLSECHTEVDPTTCLITECRSPNSYGDLSLLSQEQSISTDIKSESWVTENHMQSSSNAAHNYDGESTSEQILEITADNEENKDLDSVLCHLCNQSVVLAKLTDVVDHAKEHYHVKQFECELCGFGNNERLRVRSHAFHQHLYERPRIIEHNDENMKKVWTQIARICFPSLPERLMKEKAMWGIRSVFDEIFICGDNFEISFPFLQTRIKVSVPDHILDVCSTHNFVAVVTKEEIFIAHKDKLQDPLKCSYKKEDTLNLEFESSSWPSVVVPFTQSTLLNDWCKEKKPASDVLLTATSSTVYLICNIKGSSMVVRLFNENTYLSSGVVKPCVVQQPKSLVIVMVASGYDHSIFLTNKGAVYALGTGSRGELGVGLVPRVYELTWLEALEGLNFSYGGFNVLCLFTDDGDVYLWGWNHRGQLGDEKEKVEFYPSPLDIHLRIVRITLREHFTALWVAEDEDEPSIIMGSKKIGMPATQLTYFSGSTASEPGTPSLSSDCREEAVILGEYRE